VDRLAGCDAIYVRLEKLTVKVGNPVLDNPAWHALVGQCSHLGRQLGSAAMFDADVSPFAALPDEPDAQAWLDLAELAADTGRALLVRSPLEVEAPWAVHRQFDCVQMVAKAPMAGGIDLDVVTLSSNDVPEMLNLIELTKPGPFAKRTIEFGGYIGVRRQGQLIAMAGERIRGGGFTEISAVCTDPAYRGQGLASAMVSLIVQRIRDRGEEAMLHTAADNVTAIRVYEKLGFELRRHLSIIILTRMTKDESQ
jgi:ribosomal protein S18 acetylase RimI-like enzyme